MVDYKMLSEAVDASGLKRDFIASKIGISRYSLINKLNGKTEFTASEMASMRKVLGLSNAQFRRIFFASERELKST